MIGLSSIKKKKKNYPNQESTHGQWDIMFGTLNIQYHHFYFRSSNSQSLTAEFMQTVALKAQSHPGCRTEPE